MDIEETGVLLSKTLNEINDRALIFTENIGKFMISKPVKLQ